MALWPFFFLGLIEIYPSISHARLMIEGFLTCFVFGFLGTAGPRVMSVPHFSRTEILRVFALLFVTCVLHVSSRHALADAVFVAALLAFGVSLAWRFLQRQDSPPPNFALVGLGILNGIAGAALLAFSEATQSAPALYRAGNSFFNVGFGLLPLLGVAPFFLRRLLDLPGGTAPAKPRRILAMALLLAAVIDGSLIGEIVAPSPVWGWLCAASAFAWLLVTLPMSGNNILAASLRLSLVSILAGLALVALLPGNRVSALHIVFIGGFAHAIFTVATRVILGHSGHLPLVRKRVGWFALAWVLLLLAMISRFAADFVPLRNEHLLWGAIAWLLAVAIWSAIVLPQIAHAEQESA